MSFSYVVSDLGGLAATVSYWVGYISDYCGDWLQEVDGRGVVTLRWDRPYRASSSDPPTLCYRRRLLPTLMQDRWKRIEYFYYCDKDQGNTIRLYDGKFFSAHRELYLEDSNSGGAEGRYEDRVLVRGENLGNKEDELKARLLRCWDDPIYPASKAPINDEISEGRSCDLLTRCPVWSAKRHAYFQHPLRNAMPNDPPWACGQDCTCRDCGQGFNTPDAAPKKPARNTPFRIPITDDAMLTSVKFAQQRQQRRLEQLLALLTLLRTCHPDLAKQITKQVNLIGGTDAAPHELKEILVWISETITLIREFPEL